MTQLRRLYEVILQKKIKQKQSNGTYLETFDNIGTYKIVNQELSDTVSASIYGANLTKISRISSPLNKLEKYLKTKTNDSEDNISKYFILIDKTRYKVISVKNKWIDIELI